MEVYHDGSRHGRCQDGINIRRSSSGADRGRRALRESDFRARAGGNDDPNVVHACIGNVTKIVRVVGVTGSCLSSPPAPVVAAETPAHWAIKGKDGKDGLNGTSVSFVDYFSGSVSGCTNGGAIYAAGNPPVHVYVCNGTNGIDGNDGKDGKDGTNATRADGPCFDDFKRYVDCGNGTVTDTVTGLIWLKDPVCGPISQFGTSWTFASLVAAGLKNGNCGLTDNSSPGDWRLPTKEEWEATIARAVALECRVGWSGGPPTLTDDGGITCYGTGTGSSFPAWVLDPFFPTAYWSSSALGVHPATAWKADLAFGVMTVDLKTNHRRVWPVRAPR